MGREIRRVPPNWQHPQKEVIDYRTGQLSKVFIPLFGDDIEVVFAEWLREYAEFVSSRIEEVLKREDDPEHWRSRPYSLFCQWHGEPPVPDDYVDYEGVEPTWYQVYETVSEGTPVTPPFSSEEELIDYLCSHDLWSREAAENFVRVDYSMPSGAVIGGRFIDQTQEVIR